MAKIKIEKDKCKGCNLCILYCPGKLLRVSSKRNKKGIHAVEIIDNDKCTGCSMCAVMCPDCAIEVYK